MPGQLAGPERRLAEPGHGRPPLRRGQVGQVPRRALPAPARGQPSGADDDRIRRGGTGT
jgi:hypothetical protein